MPRSPGSEPGGCPAEITLDFLAGKWRPMAIYWLLQGPMRFNELQRRLGGVTHRTLSKTLKEMEADGLLVRRDYGEIPPRVDYSLTPRGRTLEPVLRAMEQWARKQQAPETGRDARTPGDGALPAIEGAPGSHVKRKAAE